MIASIILFISILVFRLVPPLWGGDSASLIANFSPLTAIALCGAAFLPKRSAALATFGGFLASDVILNLHAGTAVVSWYTLVVGFALALTFGLGWLVRRRPGLATLFGATLAGTILFHLITNTASFVFDPGYARSFGGWIQCLTLGLPQFSPPTYVFFLKSLAGNLFFTALFLLLVRPQSVFPAGRRAPGADSKALPV